MLRRTWRETRPAIAALTELADAGGHHEVWRILRALLPGMLPGEGRRITATHAELVAFAADVARWTGARGRSRSSPGSRAAAGRSASSTSASAFTPSSPGPRHDL
nr:hypothetical protein GCM10020093_069060 [Planobispora longispora]